MARRRARVFLFGAQALGTLAAVALFAFVPAEPGPLLVVPIGRVPAHVLLATPNSRLLGKGPWRGSLVMRGDAGLFWQGLRLGLVVMRGRATGCATGESENAQDPNA